MTPAHRRTLETLADPERRAGLRRDEREAVRAALGLEAEVERLASERDALIAAVVSEWPNGRWRWLLGGRRGLNFATRAEAVAHLCRTLGLEVSQP